MGYETSFKGDLAVGKVIAHLTEAGNFVSIPLSQHLPYDIIAENKKGNIFKISVKYVKSKPGSGVFKASLTTSWSNSKGSYRNFLNKNRVDYIALYCPEYGKPVFIPSSAITQETTISVRFMKDGKRLTKIFEADNFLFIDG